MSKRILFIVCVCLTQIITAQQKRFIGGLLLNFNGIEFKGSESQFWNTSNSTKIDGTLGSSVGLFVKRDLTKKIYTTLELRYIRKGSIYEFISEYGTRTFETLNLR
jgi:hypothetical protein